MTRNERKRRVRIHIAAFLVSLLLLCTAMVLTVRAGRHDDAPATIAACSASDALTESGALRGDDTPAAGYADLDLVPRRCLGEFTITWYCACDRCCGKSDGITATGTQCIEGITAAVDQSVIALGTEFIVSIDGVEHTYCAEDTGGAIKGNKIDIYVQDHAQALQNGVKSATVYVLEE